MSNKNLKVEKVENVQPTRDEGHSTIYVDKLSSLAMGPNVTRLGLGLEEPHLQQFKEKYTLIMPTASVIEMIEILTQSLKNPSLKDSILKDIEKYKSKF